MSSDCPMDTIIFVFVTVFLQMQALVSLGQEPLTPSLEKWS